MQPKESALILPEDMETSLQTGEYVRLQTRLFLSLCTSKYKEKPEICSVLQDPL